MDKARGGQRDAEDAVIRVLQAIVQLAGGRFVGKTNLFKAYYWAHRYFWRDHEGTLTPEHRMVRMPFGPGIDGFDLGILERMQRDGLLTMQEEPWSSGNGKTCVFHLNKPVELEDGEYLALQKALRHVKGRTATALSDESHEASWSWRDSQDGEPLDIYLDELSEAELGSKAELLKRAQAAVDDVFS